MRHFRNSSDLIATYPFVGKDPRDIVSICVLVWRIRMVRIPGCIVIIAERFYSYQKKNMKSVNRIVIL